MSLLIGALILVGCVPASVGFAETAQRFPHLPGTVDSYCSRSATQCTAIKKSNGDFVLVFITKKPVNSFILCVTSPSGKQRCKKEPVNIDLEEYSGGGVLFRKEFPHNVDGTYGVSWRFNGKRVGPVLHFVQK